VPAEVSEKLFAHREMKNPLIGKGAKDILEKDKAYQEKVRKLYLEIAKKENWIIIECCKNGVLRKPEDIHEEVFNKLKGISAI
jgi:thymidylate kinase